MDWSKVKNVPKYNPVQFELARHLDGLAIYQFAKRAGLTTKRYKDIEKGNVEPTEEEVQQIIKSQTHVLDTFFMQWNENELVFDGCIGRNVLIDYYKFKIFRDVNPPPLSIV